MADINVMMIFLSVVLLFLTLRFCVTLFNFLSNPKLGYYGKHFADKVSVIVLSSHDQSDVSNLMSSIDKQEYRNVEVIVQRHESVAELIEQATGAYYLFITPAITIHHGLLNNLIFRTKVFDLGVLSLIPTYNASGFLARCIYPINDFLLLNLFPLRLVRLSNNAVFAAGSNDCLFFDAGRYKRLSLNLKQRNTLPVATEIVKQVKQQGFNAEVLLGNRLIQNKVTEVDLKRFSKGLLMYFSNNNSAALIYMLLVVPGTLAVLIIFEPVLLTLPLGLIFMSRLMIAFMTSQNPLYGILFHPIQMLSLFVLVLRAVVGRILTSIKLK